MREKLIELHKVLCASLHCNYDEFQNAMTIDTLITAENLIANGVTLASSSKYLASSKWIPVTERLPEENGYYLCVVCVSAVNQRKEYRRMILFLEENVWIDMANCFRTKNPLYWMHLPEPPKGE